MAKKYALYLHSKQKLESDEMIGYKDRRSNHDDGKRTDCCSACNDERNSYSHENIMVNSCGDRLGNRASSCDNKIGDKVSNCNGKTSDKVSSCNSKTSDKVSSCDGKIDCYEVNSCVN